MIVGDPLCRPWADIPQVDARGVAAGDTIKGKVVIFPSATLARQGTVDRFELFVDGLLTASCSMRETLEFDSAQYCDGFHELRVVGIDGGPIESQGRLIIPVHFANYGKSMQFEATPKTVRGGRPVKLSANAPGCIGVAFYHGRDMVGKFAGASGDTTVDSAKLGEGPVTIRAVGWGKTLANIVEADPVQLTVENGTAGR